MRSSINRGHPPYKYRTEEQTQDVGWQFTSYHGALLRSIFPPSLSHVLACGGFRLFVVET
eukprot:1450391-Amphidinium_carterae.1